MRGRITCERPRQQAKEEYWKLNPQETLGPSRLACVLGRRGWKSPMCKHGFGFIFRSHIGELGEEDFEDTAPVLWLGAKLFARRTT